jgi:LmbE family N-acetylglucosaminyl deacetylase
LAPNDFSKPENQPQTFSRLSKRLKAFYSYTSVFNMQKIIRMRSLFSNPQHLPLQTISALAQSMARSISKEKDLPSIGHTTGLITSSTLVVAPHPDDETLGCGGLVALLRSQNLTVQVLVVTDGAKSHPHSKRYPADKLTALRQAETLAAMQTLGVAAENVNFLQLPDGAMPDSDSPDYEQAVARCTQLLQNLQPFQTVVLPWRYDPHPDHRATWQLLYSALELIALEQYDGDRTPENRPAFPKLPYKILEYPIWDWDAAQRQEVPDGRYEPWRLDIHSVLELKKKAIAAYRSQVSDLIDDDPTGFRLSPQMVQQFSRPWEMYIESAT